MREDRQQASLLKITSELSRLWDCPELVDDVSISFSKRLRRSLGVANLEQFAIRLHPCLQDEKSGLLREVLCHEMAHLYVHRRYGKDAKPHGEYWQELVQSAGYKPRVKHTMRLGAAAMQRREFFNHWCPVCQNSRISKRIMNNWRCASCQAAGLDGQLVIDKVSQ